MSIMSIVLLVVSLSLCFLRLDAQTTEVDVIIMGAGMAGIKAGHVFASAGLTNFLIIEAQDYIGGRTKSVNVGPNEVGVNAGASWISGACYQSQGNSCFYRGSPPTAVNPMLTLALDYGIAFARTDIHEGVTRPPFLNGTSGAVPAVLINTEYRKWDASQECLTPMVERIYDGELADMSYAEGLQTCLWRPPLTLIEESIQWAEFDLEFAYDIHAYGLGNSELDTYYLYGNQDLLITDPRGFQGITLGLASDYLDVDDLANEPKIALNAPIETIDYDAQGGVTVHVRGGATYHAPYGLVTFSIGVLQSELVHFRPLLPVWKRQAITKTGYAHYCPVYIVWPYAFWSDAHPEIDESEIVVMMDARYGYFPWFLNLNHADLMPGSLMWRFDVTEELALKLQNQDVETTTQELIHNKFSHYFEIADIPEPVEVRVCDWSANEYTQGAYTAYPVGYDWDAEVHNLQWAADMVLYFAGEATYAEDSGYVHAAYFAGERAGNQLLDCLGYHTNGYKCQGPYYSHSHNNHNQTKHP